MHPAERAKVAFGFFSFTEVTDPGEHRSYNEWHQLDHLPEQFPLPGIVYGQRWVSTPACRTARVASAAPLDAVHYLTCYLMAEPIDSTLDDFFALGAELHRADRFHLHRRAHLTGPFRVGRTAAAARVLVSAAAVPYRPHRGIYAVVEEPAPAASSAYSVSSTYDAWVTAELEPALLATPGVAGLWTFASDAAMTSRRWTPGVRRITVCWLDDEPLEVAARLDALEHERRARAAGTSTVTFAGPFETITPWQWDWFER